MDLRFGLSESGSIYVITKQDGKIRRLVRDLSAGAPGQWSIKKV